MRRRLSRARTVAQVGHNEGGLQALGWDFAPDGKRLLIDTATTSSEPVTVLLTVALTRSSTLLLAWTPRIMEDQGDGIGNVAGC
jgi:hypothetical protein